MQPDSLSERLHHLPDLPADFDPGAHPILALHWFGLDIDDDALDLDKEAA